MRVTITDLARIASVSILAVLCALTFGLSHAAAANGFDVVTVPDHVMKVTNASPGDYVEASVTLRNDTGQVLDVDSVLLMTGNLVTAGGSVRADFYSCNQPYFPGAEQYRFNCSGSQKLIKSAVTGQRINQFPIESGVISGSTLWFKVRLTLIGGNEIQNTSGVATIRFIAEAPPNSPQPSPTNFVPSTNPNTPHHNEPTVPPEAHDELPMTGAQIALWLVLGSCCVIGGAILVRAAAGQKGKHHA